MSIPRLSPVARVPRVWFVTGASRGLGARLVEALLAHGELVAATARDPQVLRDRHGDQQGRLLALALDVTDEAQAQAAVAATKTQFGRIDVLVNNAGFGLLGAVEEASADELRRLYETNVFGLMKVTRAVLPLMREQRSGHLLNLSSLGGYRSAAGFGVYCSTKFAVEGLTEALHDELAPLGIHATVVEPGYFRTDFLDARSLAVSPPRIADYAASAGRVRELAAQISHRQPGDPVQLAQALIRLVEAERPPLRLPLGSDALQTIRDKHRAVEAELVEWQALARSTDFADAAAGAEAA